MSVYASEVLRQETAGRTQAKLVKRLAALCPGSGEAGKFCASQPALASKRWLYVADEAAELGKLAEDLVKRAEPQLLQAFSIGVDTAAEVLVVVGDNPERIHAEAALAKLGGISQILASSEQAAGRHNMKRGGHRQLKADIFQAIMLRIRFHPSTIIHVGSRTAEGKTECDSIRCLKCAS